MMHDAAARPRQRPGGLPPPDRVWPAPGGHLCNHTYRAPWQNTAFSHALNHDPSRQQRVPSEKRTNGEKKISMSSTQAARPKRACRQQQPAGGHDCFRHCDRPLPSPRARAVEAARWAPPRAAADARGKGTDNRCLNMLALQRRGRGRNQGGVPSRLMGARNASGWTDGAPNGLHVKRTDGARRSVPRHPDPGG